MAFVTTVAPKKRAPRPQGVAPTAQWSWTPAPHRRSGPDRRPGRSPARCAWGARASPPLEAGAFEKTNNGAFCLEICSVNIWKVGMFGDWFWGIWRLFVFGRCFTGQNMTQPEWWAWKLFLGKVISKSCGKQPDAWGCLLTYWYSIACLGISVWSMPVSEKMPRKSARISQNHTTSSPSLRLLEKHVFFGRAILEINHSARFISWGASFLRVRCSSSFSATLGSCPPPSCPWSSSRYLCASGTGKG